jgi:hypothetical protein
LQNGCWFVVFLFGGGWVIFQNCSAKADGKAFLPDKENSFEFMAGRGLHRIPDISGGLCFQNEPAVTDGPAFGRIDKKDIKQISGDAGILFTPELAAVDGRKNPAFCADRPADVLINKENRV